MLGYLKRDIAYKTERMYGSVSAKNVLKVVASDGTLAMILLRTSQGLCKLPVLSILGHLLSAVNMMLNGIVVGRGAKIGPGMVIMHSVGIVINASCVVGEKSVFQSGVVLGSIDRKSPTIGDNVFFGAGCKVLGGIKVGDCVKIGANAVGVKDVPSEVTVVGIPARILGES